MDQLLHSIYSSPWFVSRAVAEAMLPKVAKLSSGESVDFEQRTHEPYFVSEFDDENEESFTSTRSQIVVIPIRGTMTKRDQFCGPEGMLTINERLKQYDQDDNIKGIIFDCESGGGQASGMETLTNTIKSLSKPTIASVSLCASACYYLASACDEVYATEKSDILGSIGTMWSIVDYTEMMNKEGVKVIDVYASKSTRKNQMSEDVKAGKKKYMIEEFLDPMNNTFIQSVKQSRPGISEEVFTGEIFNAQTALNYGMIDGIKTFDEVVDRLNELVETDSQTNRNEKLTNNSMNKTVLAVAAFLGMASFEKFEKGTYLSEEDLEKIGARLQEAESMENELEGLRNSTSAEALSDLTERLNNLQEQFEASEKARKESAEGLATFQKEVSAFMKAEGASQTNVDFTNEEETEEADELSEVEARLARQVSADLK